LSPLTSAYAYDVWKSISPFEVTNIEHSDIYPFFASIARVIAIQFLLRTNTLAICFACFLFVISRTIEKESSLHHQDQQIVLVQETLWVLQPIPHHLHHPHIRLGMDLEWLAICGMFRRI
jgi:hypothetical protein